MKCQKCGAELHPDQKVCLECGALSQAAGMYYAEVKAKWRPTRSMIYAAAGAALLIIILLVANSLRTVPPEVVVTQWFDAMLQRQLGRARGYSTPNLEQELAGRSMDLMALSDEFVDKVRNEDAIYRFSKPEFDVESDPTTARITITLTPTGDVPPTLVLVDMVKVGRQWKIDRAG